MYFLTSLIRRRLFHLLLSLFFYFGFVCWCWISLELRWISRFTWEIHLRLISYFMEVWHSHQIHTHTNKKKGEREREKDRDWKKEQKNRKHFFPHFWEAILCQRFVSLYRAFYLFFTGSESSISKALCYYRKKNVGWHNKIILYIYIFLPFRPFKLFKKKRK